MVAISASRFPTIVRRSKSAKGLSILPNLGRIFMYLIIALCNSIVYSVLVFSYMKRAQEFQNIKKNSRTQSFQLDSIIREKSSAYMIARTRRAVSPSARLISSSRALSRRIARRRYAESEDRLDRANVRSAGSSTLPIPAERNGSTIPLSAARFLLGEGSAMMDRGWTRPRGDRTEELPRSPPGDQSKMLCLV